jgi:RNA-directed DNA polymerase
LETKLARIAQIAKERPKEQFTGLAHLINKEMLLQCHFELSGNKATGIDAVTKKQYDDNVHDNIEQLYQSLKSMTYKPQAVRRVYIPKPGSSKRRPLGIPAYEDKIVQMAVSKILTAIYEQDFLHYSYGFRPGRSCHDALREVNRIIIRKLTG